MSVTEVLDTFVDFYYKQIQYLIHCSESTHLLSEALELRLLRFPTPASDGSVVSALAMYVSELYISLSVDVEMLYIVLILLPVLLKLSLLLQFLRETFTSHLLMCVCISNHHSLLFVASFVLVVLNCDEKLQKLAIR